MNDGSKVPSKIYNNMTMGVNVSCDNASVSSYAAVTYPGSTQGAYYANFTILDTAVAQRIIDGTIIIAIQGCFTYKTLDALHNSKFCTYLEPAADKPPEKWNFKDCSDGNDAD